MDNSLKHYGVLGMRWGVRKATDGVARSKPTAERTNNSGTHGPAKAIPHKKTKTADESFTRTKSAIDSSNDLVKNLRSIVNSIPSRSGKTKSRALLSMTDQELRDRVNRMNLERQYSSLSKDSISKGRKNLTTTLDVAGGILGSASSALAIALAIKSLTK